MAERLNLDTLVSSVIHSHNYIRVDGVEASNSKYVRNYEREKGIYSSPRNIRKLYIKRTGIDIVYYRPIVGGGDSLSETISYSEANKKLLVRILMSYIKEFNGQMDGLEDISVQGTGFASFKNDLSVSNIEELYFDWTLLLGNKELLGDFLNMNNRLYGAIGIKRKTYEFYSEINTINKSKLVLIQADTLDGDTWDKTQGSRELMQKLYGYLIQEMCGGRQGGLSANFPRLKYIGFISNSNVVLKSNGGITKEVLKYYEFNAIYNKVSADKIKEMFGTGDKFRFSLFMDTGVDLYSAGFRVDTGLYQFDADFLNDLFKNTTCSKEMTREAELTKWFMSGVETRLGLESKLWWVKQFRNGELSGQKAARKSLESIDERIDKPMEEVKGIKDVKDDEEDRRPRNELEVTLNKVLRDEGEDGVKYMFTYLKLQINDKDIRNAIEQFSPYGKEYYMKVFESAD